MKRKNFPGRKLTRKLKAEGKNPADFTEQIALAKSTKTKKRRGKV